MSCKQLVDIFHPFHPPALLHSDIFTDNNKTQIIDQHPSHTSEPIDIIANQTNQPAYRSTANKIITVCLQIIQPTKQYQPYYISTSIQAIPAILQINRQPSNTSHITDQPVNQAIPAILHINQPTKPTSHGV